MDKPGLDEPICARGDCFARKLKYQLAMLVVVCYLVCAVSSPVHADLRIVAWTNMFADGPGQAFDAVEAPGEWRDNADFLAVYTQDPRKNMDDYFDLQLVLGELLDGAGLDYVPGAFYVFTNNGTHTLGGVIDTGAGANAAVLAALMAASDHLPLAATYYQFEPVGMLAADFDGDVDRDDFLLWQRNFSILDGTAIRFSGDANSEGNVDGDDFLIRQNNIPCPPLDPDPDCESDFTKLFDGKTLNGWIGGTKGYAVEDGKLICRPKTGRNLFTAKEYSDFVLRFEFKLTPGANNGLGIRCPLKGAAHFDGIELQIMDNTAPRFKNLHPWQYHGSIYGVVSAKRGHLKPVGQWNSQEVICQVRRIKVILNGVTIVDADVDDASTPKTLDGKPHPGLKRTKGHIGFLGHGDRVEFRNIRIKVLPDQRKE